MHTHMTHLQICKHIACTHVNAHALGLCIEWKVTFYSHMYICMKWKHILVKSTVAYLPVGCAYVKRMREWLMPTTSTQPTSHRVSRSPPQMGWGGGGGAADSDSVAPPPTVACLEAQAKQLILPCALSYMRMYVLMHLNELHQCTCTTIWHICKYANI